MIFTDIWSTSRRVALQGVFVYHIDALRGSRESTRCRHQLAHLEGWVRWFCYWWHHVSWRECMCSTQFMWWLHDSKPESIWSNDTWSGGVCLHESYATMHHGFSLWHWMVCDSVRRRAKLMVCGWSNELCFWGRGVIQDDKTNERKMPKFSMFDDFQSLVPAKSSNIKAVVSKTMKSCFFYRWGFCISTDLIDLKLFGKSIRCTCLCRLYKHLQQWHSQASRRNQDIILVMV